MRIGNAEYRHHRIADEFLNRPAVALDGVPHLVEVAEHDLADGLGVDALAHRGRAGDVAEKDRCELAALGRGIGQRGAARVAEAGVSAV